MLLEGCGRVIRQCNEGVYYIAFYNRDAKEKESEVP